MASPAASFTMRVWLSLPMLATDWPAAPFRLGLAALGVPQPGLAVRVEPGQLLADERVAVAPELLGQLDHVVIAEGELGVGWFVLGRVARPASLHAAAPARLGEPRMGTAGSDARTLEVQRGLRDRPTVAFAADQVGVVDHGVVEEDLVEDGVTRHLAQRPDGDAGLLQRESEPGDALVLGDVEVGAGQQHAEVGTDGLTRPDLLPVDHPAIPVTLGSGGQAGQVRTRAGLTEELAPGGSSLEDRGHEPVDLLGGALGEDGRRGHEEAQAAGGTERTEGTKGSPHDSRGSSPKATPTLFDGEVRRRPAGLRHLLPPVVD